MSKNRVSDGEANGTGGTSSNMDVDSKRGSPTENLLSTSREPIDVGDKGDVASVSSEQIGIEKQPDKVPDPVSAQRQNQVAPQMTDPVIHQKPAAGSPTENFVSTSREPMDSGDQEDVASISSEQIGIERQPDKVPDAVSAQRQNQVAPQMTDHVVHQKPTAVESQEVNQDGDIGFCGYILWALSVFLICITFPFSLCLTIKVVQEYERAVIFRLGRLVTGGAKGPGLFFIVPCVDAYSKVDLRTVSFDVPPQEVLTKDSVTVAVDAVVYYRVSNATISVINVEDANRSTRLLAQTTLRNVLGTKNLSEILSDREQISNSMQDSLDVATDPWGIKVERVEVKDVRLPVQLQRAMAAEAEAARDARAKVIAAEGEQKASRALKEAADVITESPAALQLRYLQTLNAISAEKNSTIIFPLPIDMMQAFIRR